LESAALTRAVLWMAAGSKGAAMWITAGTTRAPCGCLLPTIVLTLTASMVSCASGCTVTNETRASQFPLAVLIGFGALELRKLDRSKAPLRPPGTDRGPRLGTRQPSRRPARPQSPGGSHASARQDHGGTGGGRPRRDRRLTGRLRRDAARHPPGRRAIVGFRRQRHVIEVARCGAMNRRREPAGLGGCRRCQSRDIIEPARPRNYPFVAALFARRRIISASSSNCLPCSCSARYFPDNSRAASPTSSPLRS